METFKPIVFITGITGGLGNSLYEEAVFRGIPVFGQSTKMNSDNIVQADFSDVSNLERFDSFFDVNNINCLINNSAIYSNTEFTQLECHDIIDMVNVNLTAPIILTKYFYSHLVRKNKHGILININSLAGRYPN